MAVEDPPVHLRRKSDKVRLAGWINVALTAVLVYFCPAKVPAVIIACFWVIAVFAVTQAIAWRMDKKAKRLVIR